MTTVYPDLSDDGKRIEVYFNYDKEVVRKLRFEVSGSSFVGKDKGGPFWKVALSVDTVKELRHVFGKQLKLSPKLSRWVRKQERLQRRMTNLANAKDADLLMLPEVLPKLFKFLRDYQRSGTSFIAESDAGCLIADQPGLGKTVQAIAGIFEGGTEQGANLVIAPVVSLEDVWQRELERFQPYPVFIPQGTWLQRQAVIDDFVNYTQVLGGTAWLVLNPQMVSYKKVAPYCPHCDKLMTNENMKKGEYRCVKCGRVADEDLLPSFDYLLDLEWSNIVLDECHKNAVRNPRTLTAQAMFKLKTKRYGKRLALSGTPIANRPIDLWGILHWIYPDVFTSKWRWVGQWLETEEVQYGRKEKKKKAKKIKGIREDREAEFYASLNPYVLRRTRAEVYAELPAEVPVPVWVAMGAKQAKQYRKFERDAFVRLEEGGSISATIELTEYLRLKQFAIATQAIKNNEPHPTTDSAKLLAVEEILDERGIFDEECGEKVVIFSQFERTVDMVCAWLAFKGVNMRKLAGEQNRKKGLAKKIMAEFQADDGPRVVVMTTQTGGVSITLDRADTCIFMDETWLASDMEQAIARLRPQSPARMHRPEDVVFAYFIRTKHTIDQYIKEVVGAKADVARGVLDKRRELLAKIGGK